jgi:hypothetical protein
LATSQTRDAEARAFRAPHRQQHRIGQAPVAWPRAQRNFGGDRQPQRRRRGCDRRRRLAPQRIGGGAHRDPVQMAQLLRRALGDSLRQFQDMKPADLVRQRHERIMGYGKFKEIGA